MPSLAIFVSKQTEREAGASPTENGQAGSWGRTFSLPGGNDACLFEKRCTANEILIKVKYPLVPDPLNAVLKLFQSPRCQDAQCADQMN
ncbi:hypothetical protein LX36DRAFT_318000 [Colletotrichum falcatum]|nr:hypothetical protein LX36DRAFT_318000 [Colletotrichum falcatum]